MKSPTIRQAICTPLSDQVAANNIVLDSRLALRSVMEPQVAREYAVMRRTLRQEGWYSLAFGALNTVIGFWALDADPRNIIILILAGLLFGSAVVSLRRVHPLTFLLNAAVYAALAAWNGYVLVGAQGGGSKIWVYITVLQVLMTYVSLRRMGHYWWLLSHEPRPTTAQIEDARRELEEISRSGSDVKHATISLTHSGVYGWDRCVMRLDSSEAVLVNAGVSYTVTTSRSRPFAVKKSLLSRIRLTKERRFLIRFERGRWRDARASDAEIAKLLA